MIVVPQADTEARAADGRGTDPAAAGRRHQAWQTAMEQAQLAQWFKPGQDASAARDGDAQPMLPRMPVTSFISAATPHATMTQAAAPGARAYDNVPGRAPGDASCAVGSKAAVSSRGEPAPSGPEADAPSEEPPGVAAVPEANGPMPFVPASLAARTAPADGVPWRTATTAATTGAAHTIGAGMLHGRPGQDAGAVHIDPLALPEIASARAPLSLVLPLEATTAPRTTAPASSAGDPAASAPRAGAAALASGAAGEHEEIRMHVRFGEQGAQVWLGLDQGRLDALPGLARQLRHWLHTSGVRLAALVCNGKPVPLYLSQGEPE